MYKKIIAGILSACMLCPISVSAEENNVLYGDANCDGIVDVCDITALKQHLIGLNELSEQGIENCGFFNNEVTLKSLGQMIKYVDKDVKELQFSYYDDGIYDEYKYKDINMNDNFEEDAVKIIIKHQYSKPNKIWTAEDLCLDNVNYIVDSTALDWSQEEIDEYLKQVTFRQILYIHLKDSSKQNVLEIIKNTMNNEFICYVTPIPTDIIVDDYA